MNTCNVLSANLLCDAMSSSRKTLIGATIITISTAARQPDLYTLRKYLFVFQGFAQLPKSNDAIFVDVKIFLQSGPNE